MSGTSADRFPGVRAVTIAGFFATVGFRVGVTIAGPASGAAFRFRGGGL
jgi:hypothetical protein